MADRLKSLRRIEAVQAQMVRLAEWRLAAAERSCREAADDQARLRDYIAADDPHGLPLARAALQSIKDVDRKLASADRERTVQKTALDHLRRRERVASAMAEAAAAVARREGEDRDLTVTIEAWLAAQSTSLP